jgi:predicted acyltransferase
MLHWIEKYRIRPETAAGNRIVSVDALRGFDMFWIMGGEIIFKSLDNIFHSPATEFINTQLEHVAWLGFRFYDIIMPLFVWLAGVSIPFSYARRLGRDNSRAHLWPHIIRRFIILWILGMAVQGNLLTNEIYRIKLYSNTLQSIAAGYLIASVFVLYLSVRMQFLSTLTLMLIYWFIMAVVPIPGIGAGLYNPQENMALFIDKFILWKFQDGTTYTWILSSLNFGATTMLGVAAGYMLKSEIRGMRKVLHLTVVGILLIILARIWHPVHPIIKHIWTGSFVFFAGGICFLSLALFYLIIDELKFQRWARAFVIIGSNSIVAYTAWHLFDFGLIAEVFTKGLEPITGNWYAFIRAIGAFIVIFMLLRYMYHNKIFVKV